MRCRLLPVISTPVCVQGMLLFPRLRGHGLTEGDGGCGIFFTDIIMSLCEQSRRHLSKAKKHGLAFSDVGVPDSCCVLVCQVTLRRVTDKRPPRTTPAPVSTIGSEARQVILAAYGLFAVLKAVQKLMPH
eukprot:3325039-Rhodomonas_salina.3